MEPGGYSGTLLVTSNGGSAEVDVNMVIDEIQQQEPEFTFYMHDHLGNTRVALYEDGAVKEYYDYYPFGMVLREVIASADFIGYTFTGKELDDEIGLAEDWDNAGTFMAVSTQASG